MIDQIERIGPSSSSDDDVFDAGTELARNVDAGLDREGVADLERISIPLDDVGLLMGLDTNAMARAMNEVLAVTCSVDDRSSDPVDLFGGGTDSRCVHRGGLGFEQHVVQFAELSRWFACVYAAGQVGAIPNAIIAEHRPPEVAQDDFAFANHPATRVVMRTRCILTSGHDREVDFAVALFEDLTAELGRNLSLGTPDKIDLAGAGAAQRFGRPHETPL